MNGHRPTRRALAIGAFAVLAVGLAVAFGRFSGVGSAASTAAPVNTSRPTTSGTAQVGQTLTASHGGWSGTDPISYIYQWLRCDKTGGNCYDAGGTTTQRTYVVQSADLGNTMRVRVKATNKDGSASATSLATGVVKPGAPPTEVNGCPTGGGVVDISKLSLPARLVIDGQTASPTVVRRSTQTLTLRFHVSACSGRPVQGALVYATAVPFEQFNVPPEATTGADGWATLTMQQAGRFPASRVQQLLAVFVRARKSGEPIAGGVSTRLLVSFPVSL